MPDACLACGAALEQPATGRPPIYCSEACKASVRYARRRVDRQLEGLERYASNLRMMGDPDRQLGRVQAEIDGAEERLRALLGG